MITTGVELMDETPFHTVLIHGLVRDAQGRKMSKSLGNGIDPLEIIEKYGADALRFSLTLGVSPGNDMRMSDEKVESARNFANKIWNAARFVMMNLEGFERKGLPSADKLDVADKWILDSFQKTARQITAYMENYDMGMAAQEIYDFIWDNYCDWYIEMAKQRLGSDDAEAKQTVREVLVYVLEGTLKLLHPFMPFITDEIYRYLPGTEGSIMVSAWPETPAELDFPKEAARMEGIMDAIRAIRNLRAEMNVAPSRRARLLIRPRGNWGEVLQSAAGYFMRLASANAVEILTADAANPEKSASAVCNAGNLFIPLGDLVDVEKELKRLTKDLENVQREIKRAEGMLKNQGFLAKAPAQLVAKEQEKLEKNRALLVSLNARIEELKSL